MSLTVSSSRVKEKCGIDNTDFDTQISHLIDDWVPVIEYAIQESYLDDSSNTGLQATLTLGATELVSGEFVAQSARRIGAYDAVPIDSLSVRPMLVFNPLDPSGLKAQGMARLRPFLKIDPPIGSLAQISIAIGKQGDDQ